MQICFFSDSAADNFLPLTYTRPIEDLRVGILSINRKWELLFKNVLITSQLPEYLKTVFPQGEVNESENCIWINNRVLPDENLKNEIQSLPLGASLEQDGVLLAACLSGSTSKDLIKHNNSLPDDLNAIAYKKKATIINQLWDLLDNNAEQIVSDLELIEAAKTDIDELPESVIIENKENIIIHNSARIEAGCILSAVNGPIYIGPNVLIEAGSILKGPVAICENAIVKMGARIYGGTTIGPYCKTGGEISGSIFHSYSNKAHDGYVGDSLIGQWCNLGADTNTSNLKNNYSLVKLRNWQSGDETREGVQFFGTVMGDHSKTAINTQLNTGTMCGVSANIFQSGFPPKIIPNFSWISDNGIETYRFEKALEAMTAMMKRRNVDLDSEYKSMMNYIFEI